MKNRKWISPISQLLLLLLACFVARAEGMDGHTGTVKGKVVTADGQPAADVSVALLGTQQKTITDEDGTFAFRGVPAGIDQIQVSLVGYGTVQQEVRVVEGRTETVLLQLSLSNRQLQNVTVSVTQSKYRTGASDDVAKMPLKNIENPQVYTTIGKTLLADQVVFTVDDAMRNATGVQRMWQPTSRAGDGGSYYNTRGFILQSQLRNGVAGNVSSTIDAANLEKLEVIKGPSATLFGSILTSYGGLINRVTKKPYAHFGGEIAYSGGNYGLSRVSADVNTPLDSAKNVLLRLNTAYHSEGSFQDNGFSRNFTFAPSLYYRVNDRLSFLFDAEWYNGRNLGSPIFFFPFGQTVSALGVNRADQLPIDYKRSFVGDDLSQQSRNNNYFGQMTYQLSQQWRVQTNITYTYSYSDGPNPYFYLIADSFVTHNPSDIGANYLSRNDQFTANSRDQMLEIQQNFMGDFQIGRLRNRFTGGLDFYSHNASQFFSGGTLDTIPSHGTLPAYRNFNRTNLDNLYATKGASFIYPVNYIANTYSAYVSDVLNVTETLSLLAALRVDHLSNQGNYDVTTGNKTGAYRQTQLAPKFGIVFQPIRNKLALFGNYQNGFTNKQGTDASGNLFKPEQANQWEGGLKIDLLGGKLAGTFSYYNIQVSNIIRADIANPNFSIQNGTQRSKGLEAEVIVAPLLGLNVVAGFSYNDSKLEKADADVEGRRPATASAPYTANWWASYKLPKGKLKGLGFGFGGNYASDNKVVNSVSQGVFILPAYTVLNATLFYDCAQFRFSVKTDNLSNQKYWIGYTTINPQKLRSVAASVAFKF